MNRSMQLAALVAALGTTCIAHAADIPKRKAGLWEIKMDSPQMRQAGGMTMTQCTDDKTDAELQQKSLQDKQSDCDKPVVNSKAGGWETTVVCRRDKTTTTVHAVATGDFSRDYQVVMDMKFDPPLNKQMSTMHQTMHARHLGACGADMKPGDTSINGFKLNTNELQGQNGKKMTPEDIKKLMEQMGKQQK